MKLFTCCLCGHKFEGYGNNAEPLVEYGICCDTCNVTKVIPARIKLIKASEIWP